MDTPYIPESLLYNGTTTFECRGHKGNQFACGEIVEKDFVDADAGDLADYFQDRQGMCRECLYEVERDNERAARIDADICDMRMED